MNKQGIRQVLASTAQTVSLCASDSVFSRDNIDVESRLVKLKGYSNDLYIIGCLMYYNGLRVSECLNINGSDILRIKKIRIGVLKGGNNRLIDVSFFWYFFYPYIGKNYLVFANYNRFLVYREFKKCGLVFSSISSSKMSVTHSLRHLYVNSLRSDNISSDEIGNSIGHINKSNVLRYGKAKK